MGKFVFNLRFIELDMELEAIERFRAFVEPQIAALKQKEHKRAEAELKVTGPGDNFEFVQLAHDDRDYVSEHVVPRFFRGPFLVAAWASWENAILVVADLVAEERNVGLRIHELHGDVVTRAQKYFTSILGMALDEDAERIKRLRDIYFLRNFIAHRNGRMYNLSDGQRKQVQVLLKKYPSNTLDAHDCLILSPGFIAAACKDTVESAQSLVNRARGGPSLIISDEV